MFKDMTEEGQGWEDLRMLKTDQVLMDIIYPFFQI